MAYDVDVTVIFLASSKEQQKNKNKNKLKYMYKQQQTQPVSQLVSHNSNPKEQNGNKPKSKTRSLKRDFEILMNKQKMRIEKSDICYNAIIYCKSEREGGYHYMER